MSALPPKADIETGPVISYDATTPAASRYSRLSATRTRRPLLQSINDCGFTNRGMDTNALRPRCPFCGLPMQFRFIEYSTLQTFECNGCQAVLNIPPQADVLEIATPVPARG